METFLLLGLFVVGGYVLGIVGFFRAQSAHAELASLRRMLEELAARTRPADAVEPAPAARPRQSSRRGIRCHPRSRSRCRPRSQSRSQSRTVRGANRGGDAGGRGGGVAIGRAAA